MTTKSLAHPDVSFYDKALSFLHSFSNRCFACSAPLFALLKRQAHQCADYRFARGHMTGEKHRGTQMLAYFRSLNRGAEISFLKSRLCKKTTITWLTPPEFVRCEAQD